MVHWYLALATLGALAASSGTTPAATPGSAPAVAAAADSSAVVDSAAAAPRVVRTFPPTEVRAPLDDLRSSETVHLITGSALRAYPVDRLSDVLALQPGVVAQGEELHVRGGRAGETAVVLDGFGLNEPFRQRPLELPLLALRSAELVSGSPGAQYGGALAGVLNLRTVDPGPRASGEWRWQTDGSQGTHYDRIGARVNAPLPVLGLGLVAAGDATLDDTWLPALRTQRRHDVLGIPFGWRADNRVLGYVKLSPVDRPERARAQVIVSRQVLEPYSPDWTVDGWVYVPANLKLSPIFSPVPLPGYQRYRAADHAGITDDRRIVALLETSTHHARGRAGLGLGWLSTRTVTSVGGGYEGDDASHRPRYGNAWAPDKFHVLWGDTPLYRESASDVLMLRGEAAVTSKSGGSLTTGAGVTYEHVTLREMDWMPFASRAGDEGIPFPYDSVRTYDAYAPGGYAYVQGRWASGGLVLNTGLRLDTWSAGPQADEQTLPAGASSVWSLAPRLGIAYPMSVRDAFSFAYTRVHQAPGRDFLYDHRTAISDRQPLGNPALEPSELIAYEAAVKHLLSARWAIQAALFYRDVFNQVGALDAQVPDGEINLRYANDDESHAVGFEWSVILAAGERRHLEAHYVWMNAAGNESRPEGDPYGPVRSARTPPLGSEPLSWDRRHAFLVSGSWDWRRQWALSWSTALASPLPWTPKEVREPFIDLALVNSRRLGWTENTNVNLQWSPPHARGLWLGLEARNLFDNRGERAATLDGYPNPMINTRYDDYGAYRTQTGLPGGAYWSQVQGEAGFWVPVHDPRLYNPPRAVRASIGGRW
jgi:outer membrane receptor protein involved in Fe transport